MRLPISSKVLAAMVTALLTTAAMILNDEGMPVDRAGWTRLITRVVGAAVAVAAAGWLKAENNPAPSAVAAVNRDQG